MTTKELTLTPEIAATYLANLYPRQRKVTNREKEYERIMRAGGWKPFNPDSPIMLDRTTKQMFNGRQRCTAVVNTGITIQVLLDEDYSADEYFDLIDGSLKRDPAQFITSSRASVRAAATRVILWNEQAFDRPLSSLMGRWQFHEIRQRADELDAEFETWIHVIDRIYQHVHLSQGVMLAALTIATRRGHGEAAQDFVDNLLEPYGLDGKDPAAILHRKMNSTTHFGRRRQPQQDWLLFVRCLNAAINDEALPHMLYSNISVWPDVGETEAEIRAKISRAAHAKAVRTRVERKVRAQVESTLLAEGGSMAASAQ